MASIALAGNYDVRTDAPIDIRFVVKTYSDLISLELPYEGLEVWVINDKKKYRYVDDSWIEINESSATNDLIWEEYDT